MLGDTEIEEQSSTALLMVDQEAVGRSVPFLQAGNHGCQTYLGRDVVDGGRRIDN